MYTYVVFGKPGSWYTCRIVAKQRRSSSTAVTFSNHNSYHIALLPSSKLIEVSLKIRTSVRLSKQSFLHNPWHHHLMTNAWSILKCCISLFDHLGESLGALSPACLAFRLLPDFHLPEYRKTAVSWCSHYYHLLVFLRQKSNR